ncbi:MAG: SpoIIE family protein phosphatase [Lachnospiraceae bacterium]|nr:SpoIIE family protein phosphatase [Lachnospiraceae bacterium]
MNEKKDNRNGGIRKKYLRLILSVIILIIGVFVVTNLLQIHRLDTIVFQTSELQKEKITSITEDTFDELIGETMNIHLEQEKAGAEDILNSARRGAWILTDMCEEILEHPGSYTEVELKDPDPTLDGRASVQLLVQDWADMNSPKLKKKLGLLGNLTDSMLAVYDNLATGSFYVALPEGVLLLVDDHPSERFDENGKLIPIDYREKEWYKEAVESERTIFTDVYEDIFTGRPTMTCAYPLYMGDELAAVVAADVFLDSVQINIDSAYEDGEIFCILNGDGQVVFSPMTEGVLAKRKDADAPSLRESPDETMAALLENIENEDNTPVLTSVDGKPYYMSGLKCSTGDWTLLYGMDKSLIDEAASKTRDEIDTLMNGTVASFKVEILKVTIILSIILAAVTILALASACKVSERIVKPLEKMTKRIGSIRGEDLEFKVEEAYRTGDEIEVLAESFSEMSERTLQYVGTVKAVTAEKERIGAELNMATSIQASQLPSLFPAFPNRKEFSLYATMNPAKEVGGDFYDFYLVDEDHIALVMADVSGKGVPAALFMMVSRVLIKSHLQNGETPGEALQNVNNQLCENNDAGLFVTVWAAVIEISTGKGISVNAGHEHPAIRRGNGPFTLVEYEHSLAVAALEGVSFEERPFTLSPGDALFVYTDGVAEAQNAAHELFDMDRMLEALNVDSTAEPEVILSNVAKGIERFVDGAEQFDDITMLCFRYDGS